MTVAMPKVLFGYKEKVTGLTGKDLLLRELTTQSGYGYFTWSKLKFISETLQ